MLPVDSLLLEFGLFRRAGFQLGRLESRVQLAQIRRGLVFLMIKTHLDARGVKPCFVFCLAGPLVALGGLHRITPGLR
jgi:hypothetical protein